MVPEGQEDGAFIESLVSSSDKWVRYVECPEPHLDLGQDLEAAGRVGRSQCLTHRLPDAA